MVKQFNLLFVCRRYEQEKVVHVDSDLANWGVDALNFKLVLHILDQIDCQHVFYDSPINEAVASVDLSELL